jgi:hypothetical protein
VLELVFGGVLSVLEAVDDPAVDAGLERRVALAAGVLARAAGERRAMVDEERLELAAELPQPASASVASNATVRAGRWITRLR